MKTGFIVRSHHQILFRLYILRAKWKGYLALAGRMRNV